MTTTSSPATATIRRIAPVYDSWLTQLKAANAIERMGEQSHYGDSNLTDIAVLAQLFQSYQSQFNLPIAITEFDVESLSAQLQADYLRDYMTMAFSQGKVDQFVHWGFWSPAHWKPSSAMYNADFSIRPNGQAYEDLVFGNWWTDTRGTSRSGAFAGRCFRRQLRGDSDSRQPNSHANTIELQCRWFYHHHRQSTAPALRIKLLRSMKTAPHRRATIARQRFRHRTITYVCNCEWQHWKHVQPQRVHRCAHHRQPGRHQLRITIIIHAHGAR